MKEKRRFSDVEAAVIPPYFDGPSRSASTSVHCLINPLRPQCQTGNQLRVKVGELAVYKCGRSGRRSDGGARRAARNRRAYGGVAIGGPKPKSRRARKCVRFDRFSSTKRVEIDYQGFFVAVYSGRPSSLWTVRLLGERAWFEALSREPGEGLGEGPTESNILKFSVGPSPTPSPRQWERAQTFRQITGTEAGATADPPSLT